MHCTDICFLVLANYRKKCRLQLDIVNHFKMQINNLHDQLFGESTITLWTTIIIQDECAQKFLDFFYFDLICFM